MLFNHVKPNIEIPELVQVNEDRSRYYVTPSGLKLPSVTTVLSRADKNKNIALEKWRKKIGDVEANKITKNSSGRGTSLHTLCEKYLQNDPNYKDGARYDALEMFLSIKSILDTRINNIHYQEQRMFSEKLGIAGTVDCIAEFDNILSVIDYKNARARRTEERVFTYFLQETAYALICNELRGYPAVKQIVTIMAVEDDEPQVFIKKPKDYVKPLLKAIEEYNA